MMRLDDFFALIDTLPDGLKSVEYGFGVYVFYDDNSSLRKIVNGKYITSWDDGETVITSNCKVDLVSREIVSISKRRTIEGPYSSKEVDDAIEILDAEYVKIGNVEYDVVNDNDKFCREDYDGYAPFFKSKKL